MSGIEVVCVRTTTGTRPSDRARRELEDVGREVEDVVRAGLSDVVDGLGVDDVVAIAGVCERVIGRALSPDESSRLKSGWHAALRAGGPVGVQDLAAAMGGQG